MTNCNLYLHWNPNRREAFYIGIGSTNRANCQRQRSKFYLSYVDKNCKEHTCIIFINRNKSRLTCLITEQGFISWIGRRTTKTGPLVNISAGGDGSISTTLTEEAKKALRDGAIAFHTGRKRNEETKALIKANKDERDLVSYLERFDVVLIHSVWLLSKTLGRSPTDRNGKYGDWSDKALKVALDLPKEAYLKNLVRRFRNGWNFGGDASFVANDAGMYLARLQVYEASVQAKRNKSIRARTEPQKRTEYTCPYCGLVGKGPNMKRYHFEKCKLKAPT